MVFGSCNQTRGVALFVEIKLLSFYWGNLPSSFTLHLGEQGLIPFARPTSKMAVKQLSKKVRAVMCTNMGTANLAK